jgi:hypothetical protein
MLPDWLTRDGYLWKELIRFIFSLLASGILLWIGRWILFNRDREIQELDRQRNLFDDLRKEFVQIFNDYYKVRKRYATVREAMNNQIERNPYIGELDKKSVEVMDSLLATCIALEAQYYTLMERIKISFPRLWAQKLKVLMERKDKSGAGKEKNDRALEFYFDRIRDYIEQKKEIDGSLRKPLSQTFADVLAALNEYEKELLVHPPKGKVKHMREYPWHNLGLVVGVAFGYLVASLLSLDEASVAIVSLTTGIIGLWIATFALRNRILKKLHRLLKEVVAHE